MFYDDSHMDLDAFIGLEYSCSNALTTSSLPPPVVQVVPELVEFSEPFPEIPLGYQEPFLYPHSHSGGHITLDMSHTPQTHAMPTSLHTPTGPLIPADQTYFDCQARVSYDTHFRQPNHGNVNQDFCSLRDPFSTLPQFSPEPILDPDYPFSFQLHPHYQQQLVPQQRAMPPPSEPDYHHTARLFSRRQRCKRSDNGKLAACEFCRGRKIACTPFSDEICGPCHHRSIPCQIAETRRGMRNGKS